MKKIIPILTLNKETLRNLDAQDLDAVKGAEQSYPAACFPRPPAQ